MELAQHLLHKELGDIRVLHLSSILVHHLSHHLVGLLIPEKLDMKQWVIRKITHLNFNSLEGVSPHARQLVHCHVLGSTQTLKGVCKEFLLTLIRYLACTTSFLAKSCVLPKLCFWIAAGGTETVKVPER